MGGAAGRTVDEAGAGAVDGAAAEAAPLARAGHGEPPCGPRRQCFSRRLWHGELFLRWHETGGRNRRAALDRLEFHKHGRAQ